MADLDDLAARLGVPPTHLTGLAPCGQADLDRLVGCLDAVFAAEDRAVEQGLRATLDAVPRPLRGRAKSLLFGKDA